MKYILIAAVLFLSSCGKKYTYTCVTQYGNAAGGVGGINQPYVAEMTERQARKYEREHSKNSDGQNSIILDNEIQTVCTK